MVPIDRIIRSRRRTVALIVEQDGSLVVRAPRHIPESVIRTFVESKADWVRRKQALARRQTAVVSRQFVDGEMFLYLGRSYPLAIVPPRRPALHLNEHFELSRSALPRARQAFIRWYKQQARRLLEERVRVLASQHGFTYQQVRISSARTRWGSCGANGTLSFTYRLVMAPPTVIDYVVVHELVHTRVHNHSRTFWNRVGEIDPDYRRHVAWLRRHGATLTL